MEHTAKGPSCKDPTSLNLTLVNYNPGSMGRLNKVPRPVQAVILSMLPPKALGRVARVCKTWLNLIYDTEKQPMAPKPLFQRTIEGALSLIREERLVIIGKLASTHEICSDALTKYINGDALPPERKKQLEEHLQVLVKDTLGLGKPNEDGRIVSFVFYLLDEISKWRSDEARCLTAVTIGDALIKNNMKFEYACGVRRFTLFCILERLAMDQSDKVKSATAYALAAIVCCDNLLGKDMKGETVDSYMRNKAMELLEGLQDCKAGALVHCTQLDEEQKGFVPKPYDSYLEKMRKLLE